MCLYISINDCGSWCWAKAAQQWHLRAAGNCCCHLAATECGHSQGSFGGMSHVQFPVWWFQIPIQSENMSCSCYLCSLAMLLWPEVTNLTKRSPSIPRNFLQSSTIAGPVQVLQNLGLKEDVRQWIVWGLDMLPPGHHADHAHPQFTPPGQDNGECPFLRDSHLLSFWTARQASLVYALSNLEKVTHGLVSQY